MDKTHSQIVGIFLGVFGVILFSAKAVMVKLAYTFEVSALHILLFRMVFALPFYFLILKFKTNTKKSSSISRKEILWLLFFGILGYYLASYFDFLGLQYIKASLERIILFIYPTLVLLISYVFLKQPITRAQLLAIGITYLGIIVTFWEELEVSSGFETILGGILIFLSALTYATYIAGSGWMIPKFGVIRFTSYVMMISCFCIVIHYLIVDRGDLLQYTPEVYILGFAMAIFATLLPSYLVSASIKILGAGNFSILGSLGPISTIILAYIFLEEKLSLLQIFGAVIVIAGITVISSKKKK